MGIELPPRVSLGFFATPLVKLARFSEILDGPENLMKRDDVSALGCNKHHQRYLSRANRAFVDFLLEQKQIN